MNLIDNIRKQNESFVQNNNFKGVKKLVVDNYNDSAHFVYELLQNADDACATEIEFTLFDDELSITHNGINFSADDVKSICSISMGTKNNDYTKIGRFGIGFKSVFAYTMNPQIHSGEYDFEIEELILPKNIKSINRELGTVFNFPLNNQKNNNIAYNQIEKKFSELCEESILFLKHLKSITLRTKNIYKSIEKNVTKKQNIINDSVCEEVEIFINSNDYGLTDSVKYSFLMMTKNNITLTDFDSEGNNVVVENQSVKIAYPMDEDKNLCEPFEFDLNDNYYVFFPTMIKNQYPFLIHAPFITKFSRDTFSQTSEANINLKKSIGMLIADSIIVLANQNLITENDLVNKFFDVESDTQITESFKREFESIIIKNYPVLPTLDRKFTSFDRALFSKENSKDSNDIISLMGKKWISDKFQCSESFGVCNIESTKYDRNNYVYFLLENFNPKILSKEYLLDSLSSEYFSVKDNEWLKKFIGLFIEEDTYRYGNSKSFTVNVDYDLKKYPLLRLRDHSHINYEQSQMIDNIYLNNKSIEEDILNDE